MMQLIAFLGLTILSVVAFVWGLFLAALCLIARLRQKTYSKQLIRLKCIR